MHQLNFIWLNRPFIIVMSTLLTQRPGTSTYFQAFSNYAQFLHSKPSRIGIRFLEDGSKVRIAKKSGSIIPWPTPEEAFKPEAGTLETSLLGSILKLSLETGPLDTPPDLVLQRTVE